MSSHPIHGFVHPHEKGALIDAAALFDCDDTAIGKAVIAAIAPVLSEGLSEWFFNSSDITMMPIPSSKKGRFPLILDVTFDVPRVNRTDYTRCFDLREILLEAVRDGNFAPSETTRIADALATLADEMRVALQQADY